MSFVIDDANLPATLTSKPMTDEEFMSFCNGHPDLFFEMTAEGEIIVMAPTHSLTGVRCSEICAQLTQWAQLDGRGLAADSSTGFVLPNGARRSPDASWTLKSRIRQLDLPSQNGFWHLCPDFVIELKSGSDRPRNVQQKMREYITNGAQLGWLIDPVTRSVMIFRPDASAETLTDINTVHGEAPVAGLILDLRRVWEPLDN